MSFATHAWSRRSVWPYNARVNLQGHEGAIPKDYLVIATGATSVSVSVPDRFNASLDGWSRRVSVDQCTPLTRERLLMHGGAKEEVVGLATDCPITCRNPHRELRHIVGTHGADLSGVALRAQVGRPDHDVVHELQPARGGPLATNVADLAHWWLPCHSARYSSSINDWMGLTLIQWAGSLSIMLLITTISLLNSEFETACSGKLSQARSWVSGWTGLVHEVFAACN
jgi:hypothetical protein